MVLNKKYTMLPSSPKLTFEINSGLIENWKLLEPLNLTKDWEIIKSFTCFCLRMLSEIRLLKKRSIPGFPQWCQGSGVTCWPQNRPWTPLPEHLALYLAVLSLAILPTEELQPAPERLGAHPSWTNPSFHAPQPLWLGLTISAASALGLWHDLGSSRHH